MSDLEIKVILFKLAPRKKIRFENWALILSLLIIFLFEPMAISKTRVIKKKKFKSDVETSMTFNDRLVGGRYQTPGDSSVVIEDEKAVFNLLSVRMNFNDRREKEKQRDGVQDEN